MNSYYYYY